VEAWWFEEHVLAPARVLISATRIGAEVEDAVAVSKLGLAIEGCFRSHVEDAYEGWPSGATTDGNTVGACVRTAEATLDVVGLMWLDFTGKVFPFRAVVTTADGTGSLVACIGSVDADTGAPPRLSADSVIVPVRNEDDLVIGAEMIVGRRQVPIAWTRAFDRTG